MRSKGRRGAQLLAMGVLFGGLLGVDVRCPGDSGARPSLADLQQQIDALSAQVGALQGQQGDDRLRELAELVGRPDLAHALPSDLFAAFPCDSGAMLRLILNGTSMTEVLGFLGREEISTLSDVVVAFRGPAGLEALGGDARLEVVLGPKSQVVVAEGDIAAFGAVDADGAGVVYAARIQPRVARLARTTRSRSFSDFRASDLVSAVVGEAGVVPNVAQSESVREFEMQWMESSLAFVSRLLEREGMYYLADGDDFYAGVGNAGFASFGTLSYAGSEATPTSGTFAASFHRVEGLYSSRATALGHDAIGKRGLAHTFDAPSSALPAWERVHFSESLGTQGDVDQRAELDALREQGSGQLHAGTSNAVGLGAGEILTLSDHSRAGVGGTYLVTAVAHAALTEEAHGCLRYANAFRARDEAVPYRPPLRTPLPEVRGPLTAVVVDNQDTDPLLRRVRVHLLWDDEEGVDSFWARIAFPSGRLDKIGVLQPPSDPGVPPLWVPEIDDEVLVDFAGGDPSLPVVVGALYNGQDTPPTSADFDPPGPSCTTEAGAQIVLPSGVGAKVPTGVCTRPYRAVSAFLGVCSQAPAMAIKEIKLQKSADGATQYLAVDVQSDTGVLSCAVPTAICCKLTAD